MKTCSKCGVEKPFDEFHKQKAGAGGLRPSCKTCRKASAAKRYAENKEQIRRVSDEWYYKNQQDVAEKRKSRRRNPETRDQVLAVDAKSREKNRESKRECLRSHYAKNKAWYLAKSSKRRAALLRRTPPWANDQLITAFYLEAKRLEELTGIQFHVDHIIPLQGELVSGLHVETNLQLLPAHENIGKSNSFDPQTFCA